MRKLILLFLSLIISTHAFATATCSGTTEKQSCEAIPGCKWRSGLKKECLQCDVNTYGDNGDCKSCSKLSGTVNGETITGYWNTSEAGSAQRECYADCTAMAEKKTNGKWVVSDGVDKVYYGTAETKTTCNISCYEDYDTETQLLNICNSYKDITGEKETCTPTWKLLDGGSMDAGDISDFEIYECDNATKGIAYYFFDTGFTNGFCYARECTSGYHLADAPSYELYGYGIYPEYYSCTFADGTSIPSDKMFQTCEPNIISCTVSLGKTTCSVEINGVTKNGTVGGNAVWNGVNAYNKDQCTCTVSDDKTTTGTYEHVCKYSVADADWDGASCETTITTCNSGYCIVGYDADNKHQTCDTAPKGYYSDGRGVLECNKCPAGKTTASTGRTSVGECTYSTETQFCDGDGVDCFKLNYSSLGS